MDKEVLKRMSHESRKFLVIGDIMLDKFSFLQLEYSYT